MTLSDLYENRSRCLGCACPLLKHFILLKLGGRMAKLCHSNNHRSLITINIKQTYLI